MGRRSGPWAPGCAGAPGPAGWLHSSLHCWPGESGAPQEQSASATLEDKDRLVRVGDDNGLEARGILNLHTCGVCCGFGDGVLGLGDGFQNQISVGLLGWRESRPETVTNK